MELHYLDDVIKTGRLCGDKYIKLCSEWIEEKTKTPKALLVTSCTHALEMAALICNIVGGDEVIMPSFTFPSSANAFVLRGGKPVFVDIRPDTMNIDEALIESAVTSKTKAICITHYAGVSCEMDKIAQIAQKYGLDVIEDAAHAVMCEYNGQSAGTFGRFGCFSFHETKNYTMGEGGALLVNNPNDIEKAEIIREKGTNRNEFLRGLTDKYFWVDIGSSYTPSELNAAYLYAQLEAADSVNDKRLALWQSYYERLSPLSDTGYVDLPHVPANCRHNGHVFYIKVKNCGERREIMDFLNDKGIMTAFHFIPLHSAPAGLKYGMFRGDDIFTTKESERILRLPMHHGLTDEDVEIVCKEVKAFYGE
jgi:dTDP-4-amino-4,6-dideoxygalactose transaminase